MAEPKRRFLVWARSRSLGRSAACEGEGIVVAASAARERCRKSRRCMGKEDRRFASKCHAVEFARAESKEKILHRGHREQGSERGKPLPYSAVMATWLS